MQRPETRGALARDKMLQRVWNGMGWDAAAYSLPRGIVYVGISCLNIQANTQHAL
jgi:hypothetical protein